MIELVLGLLDGCVGTVRGTVAGQAAYRAEGGTNPKRPKTWGAAVPMRAALPALLDVLVDHPAHKELKLVLLRACGQCWLLY